MTKLEHPERSHDIEFKLRIIKFKQHPFLGHWE